MTATLGFITMREQKYKLSEMKAIEVEIGYRKNGDKTYRYFLSKVSRDRAAYQQRVSAARCVARGARCVPRCRDGSVAFRRGRNVKEQRGRGHSLIRFSLPNLFSKRSHLSTTCDCHLKEWCVDALKQFMKHRGSRCRSFSAEK